LELFKEDFPDDNPTETFSLSTSRGQFVIISYYGNEIGFLMKLENIKHEMILILTQEETLWIDGVLNEKFGVYPDKENVKALSFENILKTNYGLSLNFNKLNCVRGDDDVSLIKTHFGKIVEFVRRSQILGGFAQEGLKFDARNSGQIILQQVLGRPLSTRGEFYEFILYESKKLEAIFQSTSLKAIFIEKLERLGFKKDSVLREYLLTDEIELTKKEIELLIYLSFYQYLKQFKNSPLSKNLAELKMLKNSLRYIKLFQYTGLRDEITDSTLFLSSEELFNFKGIETYVQYIELEEEFIENKDIPGIKDLSQAAGVFQFEWEQLVRDSNELKRDFRQILAIFHPRLFHHHLKVLDAWFRLAQLQQNTLVRLLPDWKTAYETIIPYEEYYQFLKYADIQNRVLSFENKNEALLNYESIIKELHEDYYSYLKTQYESEENLVSSVFDKFKGSHLNGILLVFDGMRFDFWKILKERIEQAGLPVSIAEEVRYAVAPTITEVSRSSIFANRVAYNVNEAREFKGNFIHSELDFYKNYNPKEKLTAMILRFIDNRIHISSTIKGEFVDFNGIQEDFARYVDSCVVPMLRHIFSSRTVQVFITSDHGFVSLDKKNRILDVVYDETIRESIKRLNATWDFDKYSDMFLVSPSLDVTQQLKNRYSDDLIIITSDEYQQYHIPKELGGDAIIFPKVYCHLAHASLRYNHGSLSMFETMVPLVKLTYKYE